MPLPAVALGQIILYYPGPGETIPQRGPIPAIITGVYSNYVNATAFPEDSAPQLVKKVFYISDAAELESAFILTTDTPPALAAPTGTTISNTDPYNFTITWTNPAGAVAAWLEYNTGGAWITAGAPNSIEGNYNSANNAFSFTGGMVSGQVYNFRLRAMHPRAQLSEPVIFTGTPSGGLD